MDFGVPAIEQAAAVLVVEGAYPLRFQQFGQQGAAHPAQVPGIDAVESGGGRAGVPQVAQEGGCRSWGHGGPHVGDVPDLVVLHPAKGDAAHRHAGAVRAGGAQQAAARRGGGPLGGGGAHRPIAQRGAELALGGAEVPRGHGQHPFGHPAGAEGRPQPQRFGHGAAGPEQPRVGHAQLPHGVAGGGALGLQVPRQGQADRVLGGPAFLEAEPGGPQQQSPLGGLPVLLAEKVVFAQLVKGGGQRAFALLFAAHCPVGHDDRRRRKKQGVPLPQGCFHPRSLLPVVFLVPAPGFCNFFPPAGVSL